jgi:hypothetical protein
MAKRDKVEPPFRSCGDAHTSASDVAEMLSCACDSLCRAMTPGRCVRWVAWALLTVLLGILNFRLMVLLVVALGFSYAVCSRHLCRLLVVLSVIPVAVGASLLGIDTGWLLVAAGGVSLYGISRLLHVWIDTPRVTRPYAGAGFDRAVVGQQVAGPVH